MSFDADDDEDAPGFRQPPHPDDRLWRHPSEMDAHPISSVGAFAPAPAGGRSWRAVAAVGALGVVVAGVAVAGLLLEDPGSGGPDGDPSSATASSEAVDEEAEAATAAAVGPAIVGIDGGSGVVIQEDGLVLTSAALVDDPSGGGDDPPGDPPGDTTDRPSVPVTLPDGTEADATVVGVDVVTGLALLDLPGEAHVAAEQADQAQVAAGSDAFNVGAAGSGAAATAGVVGATRKLQGDDDSSLDGVVEVSGRAGPDVLGGPVVDRDGTVLGVTTALGPGGSSYFTPIEVGHKVATDLLITGRVHHSWLGIEGMDAPAAGRPASGESGGTGAKVDEIYPGGPAAAAGLQDGDVVVEIAGHPVGRMSDLVRHLRALSPGERVALVVEREGEPVPVTVEVTLSERTAS